MLRQPRPLVPFTFPLAGQSYAGRILNTQKANLIALWGLGETTGTTAANAEGTTARDGSYVNGPTLNAAAFTDNTPAPSFDGSNDFVNVYSSSLNSAFNHDEITFAVWGQVSASGDWTDGVNHALAFIGADSSNFLRIRKTANNQLEARYGAGVTAKAVAFTISTTSWFHVAITVSKAADQVKVYLNGSQQGTTQTGLGTWAGSLASTLTVLAASSSTPTLPWKGSLKYAALWTTPLSSGEISALATV